MISFIYNNKNYTTNNLENKLKKLGITREQIIIPSEERNKHFDPEWKEKGLLKHEWKNVNPDSKEYGYTIVGFHKQGDLIKTPEFINSDWKLYERN